MPTPTASHLSIQGRSVPRLFYGTAWKEQETERLTLEAIRAGFRAIDTANQRKHYHEAGVGAAISIAIKEGLVARDELFLQTKYTFQPGQDHRLPYDPRAPIAQQVQQSFESSLQHLNTDHLDSLVLHGPSRSSGLADADWQAWSAMEALHAAGRVHFLGVSNVSPGQLALLFQNARTRPAFVQNRCFAQTLWDRAVRDLCAQNGAIYQGFSLLTANRHIVQSAFVADLARKYGRTPAQIVLRFALEVGMIPLTGTTSAQHMRDDLEISGFQLDPDETHAIENAHA